jgi:hypothetical protein
MKQVDAVYAAVVSITGFNPESGPCSLTDEQKAMVRMSLLEGFRQGKIDFNGDFNSEEEKYQKSYVSGLLNNHLRKDKRLNGGVKYEAKNPGSRTGQGDATLKAMRALLQTPGITDEDKAEINAEIEAHLAKIQATKAPTINWDALPESLKSKFTK